METESAIVLEALVEVAAEAFLLPEKVSFYFQAPFFFFSEFCFVDQAQGISKCLASFSSFVDSYLPPCGQELVESVACIVQDLIQCLRSIWCPRVREVGESQTRVSGRVE